ncbi:MAG: hypothetical protein QW739_02835, partial [Candidatus Odinarchaeota archaeon]
MKSKDKSTLQEIRDYYKVIEQALKVFINACLPGDEEIVIRDKEGRLEKINISKLEQMDWKKISILSANIKEQYLGEPVFSPILDFDKKSCVELISIKTEDGREIRCTRNHIIPKISDHGIKEVPACDLNPGSDSLICIQ